MSRAEDIFDVIVAEEERKTKVEQDSVIADSLIMDSMNFKIGSDSLEVDSKNGEDEY